MISDNPPFDQGVFDLLVEIMARAKTGEITGITIIGECAGQDEYFISSAGQCGNSRELAAQLMQMAMLHLGFSPDHN